MDGEFSLRPMEARDHAEADRVFRRAFGTWFQLPDPMQFRGDAALVSPRAWCYPDGGTVIERDSAMIGMTLASNWGSLGVLGPVAVLPEYWRQGVARRLMGATLDIFARWQCRMVGLFTFPQSATHIRLYQDFGFWPRHMTPIMAKPVAPGVPRPDAVSLRGHADRASLVAACRELTEGTFAGLDLGREIALVLECGLGDVIALVEGSRVGGFAICQSGLGSEGGSKQVYVKFALARPGPGAAERMGRLLDACEEFAARSGVAQLSTGVPTGRHGAYRLLIERGFRTTLMGIMMHRPWQDAYDGPETWVLDDWR